MVKYMTNTEGAAERNCLQFIGQGQKKIGFEKQTCKSQYIMNDLKICC